MVDTERNILERVFGTDYKFQSNENYIIFGADAKGLDLYDLLKGVDCVVSFFVDNDPLKQNTQIESLDVFSPFVLKEHKDKTVVIASAHISPIKKQLNEMGIEKSIIAKITDFSPFGRRNFVLKEIIKNQDKLDRVMSMLEDDLSKKTLDGIIKYCKTLDINILRDIYDFRYPQYLDDEILSFSDNEVFIDGGCLDFYTSLQFIKKVNGTYNKIYAFEPDPSNYSNCINASKSYPNVSCVCRAIYSEETTLKFRENSSFDSMVTSNGSAVVHATTLDKSVSAPTFIKFDIEGSEVEALKGAENVIKQYKPKLAICVYHTLSDLWEIPFLIKKYYPEYKLYMRHYCSESHTETVCYAVIN